MAAKRKTVSKKKAKTSIKKTAPKTGSKFYMFGDIADRYGGNERVSVAFPTKLIVDYCTTALVACGDDDAAAAAEKKLEIMQAVVAKKTSKLAAKILSYNGTYKDDAETILKAIKKRKSCATGECETVSGWGPTKKDARAEYDAMQDDGGFDDLDWG